MLALVKKAYGLPDIKLVDLFFKFDILNTRSHNNWVPFFTKINCSKCYSQKFPYSNFLTQEWLFNLKLDDLFIIRGAKINPINGTVYPYPCSYVYKEGSSIFLDNYISKNIKGYPPVDTY